MWLELKCTIAWCVTPKTRTRDDYETPNLYIGAPRQIPLVVVQLG